MAQEPNKIKNTGPSAIVWLPQYASIQIFRLSTRFRRKIANVGEIADFVSWVLQHERGSKLLPTRERLWDLMVKEITQERIRGFEFGVAYGYGTNWWLGRLQGQNVQWDGFDRFTGLPRSWRGLDAGAFNADGTPPEIDDPRVSWHVGNVEDHITGVTLDRSGRMQVVALFDLDIFEPSLVVWEHLKDQLRPGDLMYFDEAFDADERRLLDEHILPSGTFEFIGATPTALALKIVQLDTAST